MRSRQFYLKSNVVSNSRQLKKSKLEALKKFSGLSPLLKSGQMTFSYGGLPIRAMPADIVRVISQTQVEDDIEIVYRNVLLNAVISSELSSPYSGSLFLEMLSSKISDLTFKTRAEKPELMLLLRRNIGTGICYEITKKILEMCSTIGDVSFGLTDSPDFRIIIDGEKKVKGNISQIFNSKVSPIENSSIILVDGIIEKVSEIHQILESSAAESRPVIIIARKFFPDVANTLSENFKKGALSVIPFECETQDYVDDLEKLGVYCIRHENHRNLSMVSIEDIQTSYDVEIDDINLKISGVENFSDHRKCRVLIPKRYKNQSAVIEERIKSGLCFASDVSKYGVVLDKERRVLFGYSQYKTAKKTAHSFHDLVEKIGCVITRSR